MSNVKLSEPQKKLLSEMRVKTMKYSKGSDIFWTAKSSNHFTISTARALLNKGIFTIGTDGICNLTELGLTIEL